MKYVIALDAGTTSVRAFLYDPQTGKFLHSAQQEVGLVFPRSGWVEQDANEIYYKSAYCVNECLRFAGEENVAGIGVTNQRETVVLWDRRTGEPVANAIVWQCRRTSAYCAALPQDIVRRIRERTGLIPDAYFSASKLHWCFENIPEVKKLADGGNLCAGTVDSYLIFKLTGGKSFVTDVTNASRTMLFDIRRLDWDGELLSFFGVPRGILPEVIHSDARAGVARIGTANIPIAGIAGDQQAALIGQGCFGAGEAKITYGTGLFLLFSTGTECVPAKSLLTTVAYTADGVTHYALEGSMFNAGSAVQWLRDGLGLISDSAESEKFARSVPDTGGVSFVPAFTGLGAPHWDSEARGILTGITRGTGRAHVVRAVLESIAYGARELTDAMTQESGICLREIRCDGGASRNGFLMQYQADVLGIGVFRPAEQESTALGAARLAAKALGLSPFPAGKGEGVRFLPQDTETAEMGYKRYLEAVNKVLCHA